MLPCVCAARLTIKLSALNAIKTPSTDNYTKTETGRLHLRMNVVCLASHCRHVCVWRRLCDPDEGSLKKTAQVIARVRSRLKGVERTTLAEFFLRLSSLSLRSLLGPFCLLQMLTPDIRHPGRPIHFLTIRRNRPNAFRTKS